MNQIDEAARPYLTDMIAGRPVTLDATAQRAVATWATKVAVTARQAARTHTERSWTDSLYVDHKPPPFWHVTLARFNGTTPLFWDSHDIGLRLPEPSEPPALGRLVHEHGVLASFVVGYLATQVFGFDRVTGLRHDGPGVPPLVHIWPNALNVVRWPPDGYVHDGTLLAWARSLLDSFS